jgi:nitrous oxide reductase accessory protein NosL
MVSYLKINKEELADAKLWVANFNKEGSWVDAHQAYYVQSKVIKSPMGKSLLAFGSSDEMKSHIQEYPGQTLSWEEVLAL